MCPVCLTTAALAVAGVTSASGLTALAVRKVRAKHDAKSGNSTTPWKGAQDESSQSRVTK